VGAERLRGTYAFKSLFDTGARVCFGSDWPVAPFAPLTGIAAAVLRQTIDGANPGGWMPEQRVTVEQSLIAYTANNAYAGFQEDRLGRLAPGYLADLVVLDQDLLKIDPQKITDTKVLRTVVAGRERFIAAGGAA
jgi:predicted amidohydrolase YtcJ